MEIIDNVNTLFGDDLKEEIKKGSKVKIAASTFSIYAFEALKEELEKVDSLQFIFTEQTFLPSKVTDKKKLESREFHIPKLNRERELYGSDFELELRNRLNQRAIAKECADWIRRKVTFKSNSTNAPMQQMTIVVNQDKEAVYMPHFGFTAVDLGYQKGDAVSYNINKMDQTPFTTHYINVFDSIWNDTRNLKDVTETITSYIESVYKENSPESLYYFMLYNIFNKFLEDINEDVLPNDRTGFKESIIWSKLYNFQQDAAIGIINKLETYNGCILADSVGLGKTFSALAVIKYYELRNRSVLLLCPKKLAGNWQTFKGNLTTNILQQDKLNYDILAHTDLLRTKGESFGLPLDRINWGNYDLVVIDESHNFRNNDAFKEKETRYQTLMNKVIKEGVKTKVLMLSATPVNNRFGDLKNQLALAYEGDVTNIEDKLKTENGIEEIFRQAQAAFNNWSKLPLEQRTPQAIINSLHFDFFELLDSVTISRSRKHVETFYDTTDIGKFPIRRKPISFRPKLTDRTDVFTFDDIYRELTRLLLSVYTPVNYILASRLKKYEELYDTKIEGGRGSLKQSDRENSLKYLMRTNLLKRLESSVESFRLTLKVLRSRHSETLNSINDFNKSKNKDILYGYEDLYNNSWNSEDEDFLGSEDFTIGKKVKIDLKDMDIKTWEHDLKEDLKIINELLSEMNKVTPEDDFKLQHIKEHISEKISNPINQGNKKILIFTAFSDTAKYLYEYLTPYVKDIHCIDSAIITGGDNPKNTTNKNYDFQTLLTLFSPKSKDKKIIFPDNPHEIDLIIATDCISEGQNLQDCDYLINYDIHWNPVRIIQRFGRIDRIGSINHSIQLVNYWPDISLDDYINLKERVENKMVITDMTATGDDNVLSPESSDASYRKEQLIRLQDEVIELEELKTGVSITDLGLNDFRMDLLNYIKDNGDISHLPNGMHTIIPSDYNKGLYPGVIFTLRNRNHKLNINQHNRLHPFYLVYVKDDGEVLINHTNVKKILDLVRSHCKGKMSPIKNVYKSFNIETSDGRQMDRYSDLLQKSIESIIEVKDEKDLDSLFSGKSTTALKNVINGLNDFELISFIVVRDSDE